jgi:hypothetical protein
MKPQVIYDITKTKEIFEKLIHASIMRLNTTSMDKLFDLMLMGFKRQVLNCVNPQDCLSLTLHHLENIRIIVNTITIERTIDQLTKNLIEHYENLTIGDWYALRNHLLRLLQRHNTRISLFLQVMNISSYGIREISNFLFN